MSVRVDVDPDMTDPFMVKHHDDEVTYLLRPDVPLQAAAWMITLAGMDPTFTRATWDGTPRERRAYKCDCGFHIVDDSGDTEGYYDAIDDHQQMHADEVSA